MNSDYADHAFIDFHDALVWGERHGERFEKRLSADETGSLNALLAAHAEELRELIFELAERPA